MSDVKEYNLYCFYSRQSLQDICNTIEKNGGKVIMARIDYERRNDECTKVKSNNYIATDRNLILIEGVNLNLPYKHKVYETDNTVVGDDPKIFTLNIDDKSLNDINAKMNVFSDFGIIDIDDFNFDVYDDAAIISFRRNVSRRVRAIIKELLDQPPYYRISWFREKSNNNHKQKKNKK